MKKIAFNCLFLIILFVFSKKELSAQNAPSIGIISEWSVAGTLVGGYAGYDISERFTIGGFYETRTKRFDSRFNENFNFKGGYLLYDLVSEEKLNLGLMLRGGIENDRFVIVVPSISVGYQINKSFNLFMLAGSRYEKPSIGLGINYHFFQK